MKITLPFELTNGNDGRGSKWFSSAKIRKQFEADLKRLNLTSSPFLYPVVVSVTRVIGCVGFSDGEYGQWREGCENCLRRTAPRPKQTLMISPPPMIVFECEYLIEP